MNKVLLYYSSTDGHTLKICQRLKGILEQKGKHADIFCFEENDSPVLDNYDQVVIGASIRYGKHSQEVHSFIETNKDLLDQKPNAFFSVNVVARKPEKNTPETNPYVRKFLDQISWKPQKVSVFAGVVDYPSYRFFDRMMIQLIMRITKGPTDTKSVYEFTDWNEVAEFGATLTVMR